jgi:hypothetical protein
MKEFIKQVLLSIVTVLLFLTIAFGTLYFCVSCGVEKFGVEAFAAEVPDIEEPCGLTEEELAERLKYDLKPLAKTFLEAEEDYGINACFLAAISALESGWGRYQFKENNIFGFGQKTFDDEEHCIDYVAWYLRKNYLNEDGKYFRGGTIADIGKIWCPDNGEWVEKVAGIYRGLMK